MDIITTHIGVFLFVAFVVAILIMSYQADKEIHSIENDYTDDKWEDEEA